MDKWDDSLSDHDTVSVIMSPSGDRRRVFRGFIVILYENKKLPWSARMNLIYRVALMVYFTINFVVSIVPFVIKDHNSYSIFYMIFSFIGFLFVCAAMYLDHREIHRTDEEVEYSDNKLITNVIMYHVISCMGGFLIYPALICVLYGFIYERAWQFDDEKTGYSFLMFVYSVIMDAVCMKFFMICLVIRIICASYANFELAKSRDTDSEEECDGDKIHFSPVYLSILFTIATAVIHWLMIGIIAVRIYIDNFTVRVNDTVSIRDNTGDYRTASSTWYAISCAIFLPILSWVTYIIIHKLWFYEIYLAIYLRDSGRAHDVPQQAPSKEKMFASYDDLFAHLASWLLIAAFLTFVLFPYYDGFDHKVASSTRLTIHILEFCFMGLFLLTNPHAVIQVIASIIFFLNVAGGLALKGANLCYKLLLQLKTFITAHCIATEPSYSLL